MTALLTFSLVLSFIVSFTIRDWEVVDTARELNHKSCPDLSHPVLYVKSTLDMQGCLPRPVQGRYILVEDSSRLRKRANTVSKVNPTPQEK